jgi:hypothetical protein
MALARILALARIARGFAGARTFAGVDPHAHDGFSRLLGGSRGGGQAPHGKRDRRNGEGRAGRDICLHALNLLMNLLAVEHIVSPEQNSRSVIRSSEKRVTKISVIAHIPFGYGEQLVSMTERMSA